MSQSKLKVHKIQIKNKPGAEGELSKGGNMQVLLDGQPLKGVSFFKFEVKPGGIAKIVVEMFAEVDVDINTELPHKAMEPTDWKLVSDQNRKTSTLALYQLGSYSPKAIATKLKADEPAESSCNTGPAPYCSGCGCGKKEAYESKQTKTSGGPSDGEG